MKKIGLLFWNLRYLISPYSGKVSGVFILHGCRNTILPNTERLYRGQGQHVCLAHWSCLEVSSSLGAADTHSTLLLLRLLPPPAPLLSSVRPDNQNDIGWHPTLEKLCLKSCSGFTTSWSLMLQLHTVRCYCSLFPYNVFYLLLDNQLEVTIVARSISRRYQWQQSILLYACLINAHDTDSSQCQMISEHILGYQHYI